MNLEWLHKGKIGNLEYWRLLNNNYTRDDWIWNKIKNKPIGFTFCGANTKENKLLLRDILFKAKLLCNSKTYITRLFIVNGELERNIWFETEEDYNHFRTTILEA